MTSDDSISKAQFNMYGNKSVFQNPLISALGSPEALKGV